MRTDHPNCFCAITQHWTEDAWGAWGKFDSVVADASYDVFRDTHGGLGIWDFYAAHPEQGAQFNQAMVAVNGLGVSALVVDFPWGEASRIVDVGGGVGHVSAAILLHHTQLTALVFDLPEVVAAGAAEFPALYPALAHRVAFAPGSFFDAASLPPFVDGDVIMLRNILHDWPDADVLRILRSLRQAVGGKAVSLVLVEVCPAEPVDPVMTRYGIDLMMMVLVQGRERGPSVWRDILAATGWALQGVVPTRSIFNVVRALPAPVSAAASA